MRFTGEQGEERLDYLTLRRGAPKMTPNQYIGGFEGVLAVSTQVFSHDIPLCLNSCHDTNNANHLRVRLDLEVPNELRRHCANFLWTW